jgi:predicted Zn-dependent peptidase
VTAVSPETPLVSTLDNGLRLVVTPIAHARSVSVTFYMRAGSRYEQDADAGLSHFVEHLCFKGTERRPRPIDLSSEIDAVGGSINAATNRELTSYYAKVTPEHLERVLDVLSDMLRHSLYLDPEIERERAVILEELGAVEDAPDELAGVALDALLWPGQPLGRDIAGTPASVGAIAPDRLRDYYRRQYVANAAVLSIAGAIEQEEAARLAQRFVGDWEPGSPGDWIRVRDVEGGSRVRLTKKDTEQAHVALGMRGLSATDPDRYALGLLSVVLGEGMSSRLFNRLREELALCYDVHSAASHLLDTGSFGVYAGIDPERTVEALGEIARELARIREPLDAEELARAQSLTRSRVQLRMEDTRAVSALYGALTALDLPLVTPEETIARYQAVTLADVQRVAERVVGDSALHLSVVGPFEDAEPLEAALRSAG